MNFAVCEPVSISMFAAQAAGSVYKHKKQGDAVKASNRAKLANYKAAGEAYLTDIMLQNNAWKNDVIDADIAIDNIFKSQQLAWQREDLALEQAFATHAFNRQNILQETYRNEYAGEQTGVTASRLAGESIRQAGFALTKSVRDVVLNQNKAWLNKEASRLEADVKRRQQWEAIRQAPIAGHSPQAPELQAKPGIGGLMVELAIAGAGAYMAGTKLKSLQNMEKMAQETLMKQNIESLYQQNPFAGFNTNTNLMISDPLRKTSVDAGSFFKSSKTFPFLRNK